MASVFNKKVQRTCAWCIHGKPSDFTEEVFCTKRGITDKHDCCRNYKYDPLKRTPAKSRPTGDFQPEDFKL